MKRQISLAATALAAVGGLLLASPATASTKAVNHYRSGHVTVRGLTLYYKYGCVNVTDQIDADGNRAVFYQPYWNFKVVESGQTQWQYVRLGYVWGHPDETALYNVSTGIWDEDAPAWYQVHNIAPRSSVWDPANVVGPVTEGWLEPGGYYVLNDAGTVMYSSGDTGVQLEASTDGVNWTALAGTYAWEGGDPVLAKPNRYECLYRPYP